MKTKTRNLAVSALLSRMAIRLLATDPSRDQLQKREDAHWNRLRTQLPEDEIKPIETAARIMSLLAGKLIDCQDVRQVELSLSYVKALVAGEVMIAEDETMTTNV